MAVPAKLLSLLRGAGRGARAVGRAAKTAVLAVKEHPSHVLAVSWIAGMATFSVITVQRARAAAALEANQAVATEQAGKHGSNGDGPGETVALLDVDQMERLRINRMHANGLSAAGDVDEPTKQMIDDARAELAKGIEVDGEVAGTSGKIRIVSKGGIAGWIKRNKNKKADPETLAWLRGEEAREGGPAYAGWVDRGDGSILNYALDKKHGGNGLGSAHNFGGGGGDDGSGGGAGAGSGGGAGAGSSSAPVTVADVEAAANPTGPAPAPGSAATPTGPAPGSAAAVAPTPTPTFDLRVVGGAAVSALSRAGDAAHDPSEAERATLAAALQNELGADAPALAIRDHHLVALLLGDRMFDKAELTYKGKAMLRALAKRLVTMPDRAFVIGADDSGAMETVGYLLMNGVDADHMAIRTKDIDKAINLVEIEIIPLPGGGFVQGATK